MAESSMADASVAAAPGAATRALDRLLLPVIKLKSSASSKQLEQKLNYLWGAAHALLATSPALAHATAATILETARQQRAQLPRAVLDYLCQQCGALLVPSVSAAVRVVPQRGASPAIRKLARLQHKQRRDHGSASASGGGQVKCERLRNVVELSCQRCAFVNVRHGASVVYKPKQKLPKRVKIKKQRKTASTQDTTAKRPLEAPAETEIETPPEPKRAKPSDETPVAKPPPTAPRSIFAKPASPPRRLLDGKKKKKKPATSAATAQVKSSLDSFLQNLRK